MLDGGAGAALQSQSDHRRRASLDGDASLRATILASLRKLNQELGISIIYITHDLTTAYQICKDIVIMYAGAVVESGSVDQVIREPKHPYTRLLIASIPLPDKRARWDGLSIAQRVT